MPRIYTAVVRRCAFAPTLAVFAGHDSFQATVAAYKYVKNMRLIGFIIELESRPA